MNSNRGIEGSDLAFIAGLAIAQRNREKKIEIKLQVADQLKKFSDLAKDGIITQEEFEKQKIKLMEIIDPPKKQSKFLNFIKKSLDSST